MLLVVLSHDDFILIVLADDSSSDSDTNPPPITIPQLSRCGDRALVDFLNIDVDLKWDSIGRGFRDIVNSSAYAAVWPWLWAFQRTIPWQSRSHMRWR